MTEIERLRGQVHAQGKMIAVLQDCLSTALSAIGQATVPVDGYTEPVHYGPHSRTHLLNMAITLSEGPKVRESFEEAIAKYTTDGELAAAAGERER